MCECTYACIVCRYGVLAVSVHAVRAGAVIRTVRELTQDVIVYDERAIN